MKKFISDHKKAFQILFISLGIFFISFGLLIISALEVFGRTFHIMGGVVHASDLKPILAVISSLPFLIAYYIYKHF